MHEINEETTQSKREIKKDYLRLPAITKLTEMPQLFSLALLF